MSKIKIPKDHQKYLQRGFLMGPGAGSSYNTGTLALPDIYALALGRCMRVLGHRAYISGNKLLPVI